jgi:hypothetical protein
MRSVVRHSVLFCKQGEHPPGSPSHLILRTCELQNQLSRNPLMGLSVAQTHLTAVACLAGSCRRLQLLLDGIRKLLRMLSFDLLGRSASGLSGTGSFLRHLADDSPKWTGRSRGVEGRSRSVFKPSNLTFVELQGRCDNANVLNRRCRIERKRVVLLFVVFSRKMGRGVVK